MLRSGDPSGSDGLACRDVCQQSDEWPQEEYKEDDIYITRPNNNNLTRGSPSSSSPFSFFKVDKFSY